MTTKPTEPDDDRDLANEEALQPYIDMAMAAAEKAGISQDAAAHALLRLAGANLLSLHGGRTADPAALLADLVETSKD